MNIINFCKQTCKPQETALYALGGFLSGRCMGTISPMDGAVYMVAIRMAYLVSQEFNKKALGYLERKTKGFGKQIYQTNSSYFDRLKSRSGHLAASWVGLAQSKLPLLKQPMNFMNIYLSYVAGNGALYVLGKQPVGLLAVTGIFFSSTIFAILAGASIDLAKSEKVKLP